MRLYFEKSKKIADFSDFLPFCRNKRLFVYVGASVLLMKCFHIHYRQCYKKRQKTGSYFCNSSVLKMGALAILHQKVGLFY